MKRALGWLAAGVVMGTVATFLARPPSALDSLEPEGATVVAAQALPFDAEEVARLARRVASLEAQFDETVEELRDLRSELADTRISMTSAPRREPDISETRAMADSVRTLRFASPPQSQGADNRVQQLIDGGFTSARAEWIKRRLDELTMTAVEARYEAERNGTDPSSIQLLSSGPGTALRQELGDTEYEQYLRALGREPSVNVMAVIPDSPAARAGFQAGDQIVSYGGTRVFDFTEVTPLTAQGTRGESVIVDILREGQPIQIVVPRGPLGVSLYSDQSFAVGGVQQQ